MVSSTGTSSQSAEAMYGRFNVRLRGLAIDVIVFLLVMLAALLTVSATNHEGLAHVVGISVVVAYFLCEPLLVAVTGSTIGHYLSNLRVVDVRGGNIGLPKALARALIKIALGWYSFITMLTTRRHQAVHDVLTHSTVQVRDASKAAPAQYVGERVGLADSGMPSRLRRTIVILIYVLISTVVVGVGSELLGAWGIVPNVSPSCVNYGRCSDSERFQNAALGFCVIAAAVVCIVLGWRGRLWGSRVRRQST